jgi:hypothetical protein
VVADKVANSQSIKRADLDKVDKKQLLAEVRREVE